MRFPLGTLALPFTCGDPTCSCRGAAPTSHTIVPRRAGEAWLVEVHDDGYIVDEFRRHSLNEALEDVHREYPGAAFDPEEG